MKKLFLIGRKDLKLAFRDRAALLFMLPAPFALTLGLGVITGRLSGGSSSGLADIPVILVNQDGEQLGDALVDVFRLRRAGRADRASEADDPAAARQQVDAMQPPRRSSSLQASPGASSRRGRTPDRRVVHIELYTNPTRPTSVGVIKTILDEFISQVEVGRVGGQVTVTQLIGQGLIRPQDASAIGAALGARQADAADRARRSRSTAPPAAARRSASIRWPTWRPAWR